MSKSKRNIVRVKKVVLDRPAVVQVKVPPGHVPVVAVRPSEGLVEIVPVPKNKKLTWWQTFFGE